MANQESSYGARLHKSQDLLTYVNGFGQYDPPREEETIDELTSLVDVIVDSNMEVAQKLEHYREAVNARQLAFKESEYSLKKITGLVRFAVEAQFGKTSVQAKDLASVIRKISGTKLTKAPLDPNGNQQRKVSTSQQSYGSLTQHFNDLVATVGEFQDYTSSNPELTLEGLQAKAQELTNLNNAVTTGIQELSTARSERSNHYADLKERVQRIKSYVKAQFGIDSKEYKLIKGIGL